MSQIPRSFGKGSQDSHLLGVLLAAGTKEEGEAGRDIDVQGRASSRLRQLDRAAQRQENKGFVERLVGRRMRRGRTTNSPMWPSIVRGIMRGTGEYRADCYVRDLGIINQIRAFLLERGFAVRQGQRFLRAELPRILGTSSADLSPNMAQIIADLAGDWRRLDERIDRLSAEIEALARQDASCERLMSVGRTIHWVTQG
jgi:hypothetical protein